MSSKHSTIIKQRRINRVRAKVHGTSERPRLAVFRSLTHISAQIIDDVTGKTLVAMRDQELTAPEQAGKKKTELASLVGKQLAARAQEKGVKQVVFDRRDKQYHGRIRALAEGAREAGLIF
ncbi:50S ribosomal protein L18 [Candidatus Uhrbacteria bacterium]|nr:50S ribosomal protein L18 [Candidatus Uhrbacteria bacterium]